jgi:uncharacterized membrane protein YdbT with pleckstrin-like domain
MPEALKQKLIQFFHISETPAPPPGNDLKTFRAAPNYFKYSLIGWAFQLLFTSGFFLFSVVALIAAVNESDGATEDFIFGAIWTVVLGFALASCLLTFLTLRLDYEFRWYMVTDSGLRIREGIVSVHEITMAFKNIQNVTINQGPFQRLLGISDLVVQTAGGSSMATQGGQNQGVVSSHTGYFRGVDNAEEIRDIIMARLRKVKGQGLAQDVERASKRSGKGLSQQSLGALRQAAEEARLLREVVS